VQALSDDKSYINSFVNPVLASFKQFEFHFIMARHAARTVRAKPKTVPYVQLAAIQDKLSFLVDHFIY
jgi:hypothetical protein